MKKIILAIDPGSPKSRDKSATTGVFIGEYYEPLHIESMSYIITSLNREKDENRCANGIRKTVDDYVSKGYEVDIVIEEYKNYAYNTAASSYSKNRTSELIGKIKLALSPYEVTEQPTSAIKVKYSDTILSELGILEKKSNKWMFSEKFGGGRSIIHTRDACRHYLYRRDLKGMFNYLDMDIENLLI